MNNDQRTPLYAKHNGRYKFAAYLDDMHVAPTYADGLWIFTRNGSGQSAAHVCHLDDLSSDMLNTGKHYAQRDAIVKILCDNSTLSNRDLAGLIVKHFATRG